MKSLMGVHANSALPDYDVSVPFSPNFSTTVSDPANKKIFECVAMLVWKSDTLKVSGHYFKFPRGNQNLTILFGTGRSKHY
jgi:hypothetical protein